MQNVYISLVTTEYKKTWTGTGLQQTVTIYQDELCDTDQQRWITWNICAMCDVLIVYTIKPILMLELKSLIYDPETSKGTYKNWINNFNNTYC
jgi:hypothetical protein